MQPIEKGATREYLEEVLKLAKEHMPTWAYAVVQSKARAIAGGRNSRALKQPSTLEKMGMAMLKEECLAELDVSEIKDTWQKMEGWYRNAKVRSKPTEKLELAAKILKQELVKRGESLKASPLLTALESDETSDVLKALNDIPDGVIAGVAADVHGEFVTRGTSTKPELLAAVRWAFDVEKSQGVCIAYEDPTTEEDCILDIPKSPELVVKVLERHPEGERAQYTCGVLPLEEGLQGLTEYDGVDFVPIGKSLSTTIHAKPGDLLRVNARRIVYHEPTKGLTCAGIMVKDTAHHRTSPDVDSSVKRTAQMVNDLQKSLAIAPTQSVDVPKVAFVGTHPTTLEVVRKEHMVGDVGLLFADKYLKALPVEKDEICITNVIPEVVEGELTTEHMTKWAGWVQKELDRENPAVVIALGRVAKDVLGDRADFILPHPGALIKRKDTGEVSRKMKRVKAALNKKLDNGWKATPKLERTGQCSSDHLGLMNKSSAGKHIGKNLADPKRNPDELEGEILARITKADNSKHIVYGVVMDPYGKSGAQADAHEDWILPSAIEATAHAFMQTERVIGKQHSEKTDSTVVESSIEQYPSPEDYQKALLGQDHKVSRRQFGNDVIHSGSWILGVKLGEEEWQEYLDGELNAFSPGGAGYRMPITRQMMPKVSFVDLVEKDA
jgi:uracil-DNA glycosylase family 4